MTMGERIRRLRKSQGISQKELAEKVGVSRQIMHQYEFDETDPRLFISTCIADALGVSLDYLAKGGDEIEETAL